MNEKFIAFNSSTLLGSALNWKSFWFDDDETTEKDGVELEYDFAGSEEEDEDEEPRSRLQEDITAAAARSTNSFFIETVYAFAQR